MVPPAAKHDDDVVELRALNAVLCRKWRLALDKFGEPHQLLVRRLANETMLLERARQLRTVFGRGELLLTPNNPVR